MTTQSGEIMKCLGAVIMLTLSLYGCAGPRLVQDTEKNKVYVLGSVNKQVEMDYLPGMTLMEALNKADFPHNDSIKFHIRWVDKSGPVIRKRSFSYSAILKGAANNEEVHGGDIIYLYRNPIYVVLDFVERMLQPARSLFAPAASVGSGVTGAGATPTPTP
jgi:protein involved in polysaccharide export with SLBB domain